MDMPVRRDPGPQAATISYGPGATPGGAPVNAAGLPQNMYANMLAQYQQAAQSNYGQQISGAMRNKQELTAELARQQHELARKNKFWNRMGRSLSTGLINTVGQLPSAAVRMGMSALSRPGTQTPELPDSGGGNNGGMLGSTDAGGGGYGMSASTLGATGAGVGGMGGVQNPYAQMLAGGMYG